MRDFAIKDGREKQTETAAAEAVVKTTSVCHRSQPRPPQPSGCAGGPDSRAG